MASTDDRSGIDCVPREVLSLLKSFVARARDSIGDAEVYLFGSYARCSWLEDSDIDLIVVSEAFRGLDLGKRYALVRRLLPPDKSFDILTYTREEFEIARERSVVVIDAAEYWIKIA